MEGVTILVHDHEGAYMYTLFNCQVVPRIGEKLQLTPAATMEGALPPLWKVTDVSYRISLVQETHHIKSVSIYVKQTNM